MSWSHFGCLCTTDTMGEGAEEEEKEEQAQEEEGEEEAAGHGAEEGGQAKELRAGRVAQTTTTSALLVPVLHLHYLSLLPCAPAWLTSVTASVLTLRETSQYALEYYQF